MKRDMDLVRKILFTMEDDEKRPIYGAGYLKLDGYSKEQIDYHMKIMGQAGLLHVDAEESSYEGMGIANAKSARKVIFEYYSISWQGPEFLAAARNETFWKRAKAEIATVVGGSGRIMLPVLTQLLTSYIKSELKLP